MNDQFQITFAFSTGAYSLLMEGLSMLPLGRSKELFESMAAEAKRQADAFEAAKKAKPARKKAQD